MITPHQDALYDTLRKTLAGELDFDLFCGRLLDLQQTIPASDPARTVLFHIIAKIDEYESSEMTDEQLKGYLLALLPTAALVLDVASPWSSTAGATGLADLDPASSPTRSFAPQGRSTGLVTIGGR